jgi:integrase
MCPHANHNTLCCPKCGSNRLYRDGFRYLAEGSAIQRLLCRSCFYRFSEPQIKLNIAAQISKGPKPSNDLPDNIVSKFDLSPKKAIDSLSFPSSENIASHKRSSVGQRLNSLRDCNRTRQVCDFLTEESRNLTEVARQEETSREGTPYIGKIIECMLYMKKKGLAESTIRSRTKRLKRLVKLGANLYDTESVKAVIANEKWCNGMKDNVCDAYGSFVEMLGGTWRKPRYQTVEREVFVPSPKEVDQLIAACSPMMSAFLQLLNETAMRPGEGLHLTWKDFDATTRSVRITPEKGSHSGTVKISEKLASMLESLPKTSPNIFCKPNTSLEHFSQNYRKQRCRAAYKLKSPRLLQITLKTFRHFRATLEAHRTKDPFHVQAVLRHRNISNTMKYIHLAKVLFKDDEQYISRVATNVKDACILVDAGFEYVTGEYDDGGKIFRKVKDYAS